MYAIIEKKLTPQALKLKSKIEVRLLSRRRLDYNGHTSAMVPCDIIVILTEFCDLLRSGGNFVTIFFEKISRLPASKRRESTLSRPHCWLASTREKTAWGR